jgi:hypothetical protein
MRTCCVGGGCREQQCVTMVNVLFQWYDIRKEYVEVSMFMLREKAERNLLKLLGDNFIYITCRWLERGSNIDVTCRNLMWLRLEVCT